MKRYRVTLKSGESIGPILANSAEEAKEKVRQMGFGSTPSGPFQPFVQKGERAIARVEKE